MLNLARAAAARQTSNPKTCRFLVDARHTSCRKLAKFDGPRQRLRHSLTVNTVLKLGPILYVTKNLDSENVRSSNDFDATGFRAQLHHHSLVRVRLSSRGIFGSISLSLARSPSYSRALQSLRSPNRKTKGVPWRNPKRDATDRVSSCMEILRANGRTRLPRCCWPYG